MPLLDHFHPPLSVQRHWESFHSAWANSLARLLNEGLLPERYFAEPNVRLGTQVEIDVATREVAGRAETAGAGVATEVWAPPRPALGTQVSFNDPDVFEVRLLNDEEGPRVVAAIELVSPANKDRPANRRAFAVKCASYLQQQVGLVVVDVVTSRQSELHSELLQLLEVSATPSGNDFLYATAYRTLLAGGGVRLEAWREPLALGSALPTMPLWLGPDLVLPLDLEQSYLSACEALRIRGPV